MVNWAKTLAFVKENCVPQSLVQAIVLYVSCVGVGFSMVALTSFTLEKQSKKIEMASFRQRHLHREMIDARVTVVTSVTSESEL